MRMRPALGLAMAFSLLAPACEGEIDEFSPPSTPSTEGQVRAFYRVSRRDIADRAHVRYRLPGGSHVETDVTLPWQSRLLTFEADETLFLFASAPVNEDVRLQCDASTDQGPWGRTTGETGADSCTVDTSLEELGRR